MLQEITYYQIFGKPLIMYFGIITLTSFIITAAIGYSQMKGKPIAPFQWHPRMAAISITLGIIHGALGVLAYL